MHVYNSCNKSVALHFYLVKFFCEGTYLESEIRYFLVLCLNALVYASSNLSFDRTQIFLKNGESPLS